VALVAGSERNKALGIWGGLGGIGATAAWLIGGPLVDGPGWQWIFFINIPVGLAALALSPMLLRESRDSLTRRSFDPARVLGAGRRRAGIRVLTGR
jgi:MFS family permease